MALEARAVADGEELVVTGDLERRPHADESARVGRQAAVREEWQARRARDPDDGVRIEPLARVEPHVIGRHLRHARAAADLDAARPRIVLDPPRGAAGIAGQDGRPVLEQRDLAVAARPRAAGARVARRPARRRRRPRPPRSRAAGRARAGWRSGPPRPRPARQWAAWAARARARRGDRGRSPSSPRRTTRCRRPAAGGRREGCGARRRRRRWPAPRRCARRRGGPAATRRSRARRAGTDPPRGPAPSPNRPRRADRRSP